MSGWQLLAWCMSSVRLTACLQICFLHVRSFPASQGQMTFVGCPSQPLVIQIQYSNLWGLSLAFLLLGAMRAKLSYCCKVDLQAAVGCDYFFIL